ncbi:glycosyltransferase family 2 protein [Evansella sp. AB-rgal1]|uniref:glycosyltransferase n=1 Tax=Evansella sp. AB-rgal1 TaxID=3242696 RepID=UPI00359F09F9
MYTILSAIIFIGATLISLQWFFGIRKLVILDKEKTEDFFEISHKVSIIVAAKNEEKDIKECLESLLNQLYKNMEIIIVNDRSTDNTGPIIDILATNNIIKAIHIKELPHGWLGKNHALYKGAQHATGDWLLFVDGDVIFTEHTVEKAVQYTERKRLDHLTLMPENLGGTFFYRTFHSYWSIIGIWNFIQLRHAGVGAFNFIKRTVYDEIGTHAALPLAPDDDLKLGKKIVEKGFKQQLGFGTGLVRIQWYEDMLEVIRGLEKNLFAFMRYNLFVAFIFSCVIFLVHVLPFIGLLWANSVALVFHIATIVVYVGIYLYNKHYINESFWHVCTVPIHGCIFIYCILRSAFKAISGRGIEWRGTTYSLKELKRGAKKPK